MENQVLEIIKKRRSIRSYKPEQITEEQLQAIMEAGVWAPTAINKQTWHFSVVQDRALLQEINEAAKRNAVHLPYEQMRQRLAKPEAHIFYNAPTVIFVSGEPGQHAAMDTSFAVQNMLLAATSLGVGSLIMMMHHLAFQGEEGAKFAKRVGVPEGYAVMQAVCLGYATEQPAAPERKSGVINFVR